MGLSLRLRTRLAWGALAVLALAAAGDGAYLARLHHWNRLIESGGEARELAALLVPVEPNGTLAPLAAGKYTLQLTMTRSRWREASPSDVDAVYTQSQTFELNW